MKKHLALLLVFSFLSAGWSHGQTFNITRIGLTQFYRDTIETDKFGTEIPQKKGLKIDIMCTVNNDEGSFSNETDTTYTQKEIPSQLIAKDSNGKDLGTITLTHNINEKESPGPAYFTINCEKLPSTGAKWIEVKGSIPFSMLDNGVKSTPHAIDLQSKSSFTIDNISFTTHIFTESERSLAILSTRSLFPYQLVFTDATGKRLNLSCISKSDTPTTIARHYYWDKKPDQINLSILHWKSARQVTIPVSFKTTLIH